MCIFSVFPFPCDWFLKETTHIYKITQRRLQENAVLFSTKKAGQARSYQNINHWIQAQTANINYSGKKIARLLFYVLLFKTKVWLGGFFQSVDRARDLGG